MKKLGSLSNNDGDSYEIVTSKVQLRCRILSGFIGLIGFFWQFFLELNSKRQYRGSGKEKESRCLVITSCTKREIRHLTS